MREISTVGTTKKQCRPVAQYLNDCRATKFINWVT